jgi:hypothetical protein
MNAVIANKKHSRKGTSAALKENLGRFHTTKWIRTSGKAYILLG